MSTPSVEMIFRPNVTLVPLVRRFVHEFYTRIGGDADAVSQLAVATHELLENAVKFAATDETRLKIEIDKSNVDRPEIIVRAWNRATPEALALLKGRFEQMHALDPFAFYQQRMHAAAVSTVGSGLGLPRVCAEAGMTLRLDIDADDWVCVTARASANFGAAR